MATVLLFALAGCSHAPPQQAGAAPYGWQSVRVDTPGTEGAACALQYPSGSSVVLTPARVDLPRGPGTLAISCSKGEHFRGSTTVAAARVPRTDDYSYPDVVAVPMSLYEPSLKADYKVMR
jgi:hypothetical protein